MRASIAVVLLSFAALAQAREIVVGQIFDSSGDYLEASRDFVAGAKTCFDAVNARGGIGGNTLRHVAIDGGATPESRRAKLRELLDAQAADVLFGFVGDETVRIAGEDKALRQGGIALVGPLAGASQTLSGVFFVRPTYEAEVRQMIDYFRTLHVERFAVVKAPNDFGRTVGDSVEKEISAQRLALTGAETLGDAAGEIDSDVERIARSRPQALILAADTVRAAEFIRHYKPRDPGAMMVGLSTMNHQVMFQILGPQLASGVMITQVVPNPSRGDSPLVREYLAAMRKFRDEPPSNVSLEGYIAAKVLVEAIRAAGAPGRKTILQAMRKMRRLDLGGFEVDLSQEGRGRLSAVEMTMIRKNGALLQ